MSPKMPSEISRRAFLKVSGPLTASALALEVSGAEALSAEQGGGALEATSRNPQFELTLSSREGLQVQLRHNPTGLEFAKGQYSYSFGSPRLGPITRETRGDITTLATEGSFLGTLSLKHEFRLSSRGAWIEEHVAIRNETSYPLDLSRARCGLVLPVPVVNAEAGGPFRGFKFTAVPYRREPTGDRKQYADYTLNQILTEPRSSRLRSDYPIRMEGTVVMTSSYESGIPSISFPFYASEGWVLTDGKRGFLITKYSQIGMEWALLNPVPLREGEVGLCWGGFGIFQGDPEHAAQLAPGSSHSLGVTRLTFFDGGLPEGFNTFRSEMESRGHGCPRNFNPPLHWNELYDNKLWHLGMIEMDKPENRRKYYQLADMLEEAGKARSYSCEALYLDPGWDTSFASKIWDESRLKKLKDFTTRLRNEYGLALSLHTPLAGWCNPSSYPREMDRMNRDGQRVRFSLCAASRQYLEETLSRLETLARDGATFFMFDGTMFHGDCWDPGHGHPVPSRREEHVQGNLRLARMVHNKYPKVLIEMHDPLLGGTHLRYVPTYYGHGTVSAGGNGLHSAGFDTVWAFELMWDPMADLVGGHSIALYYYNLAYSLPLYIHIDLRTDNAQALMFWWNASTCRHLGIGGTHRDPEVQKAHKDAAATYRRLKPFFASGTFYGIDELTHVHRHPSRPSAIINCFNLESQPSVRRFVLQPAHLGLDPSYTYEITGGKAERNGEGYEIEVSIASYGHSLIECSQKG